MAYIARVSRALRTALMAAAAIGVAWPLAGQQQITVKLEFENEHVRVERVTIPPGRKSEMHSHPYPSLEIFLTDDHVLEILADGKRNEWKSKAGEVAWGGAATHRVENLSKTPVVLLSIEFKSLPPAAAKLPGGPSALELENEWVKVTRGRIAPKQKGAVHSHPMYIGVFLSDAVKIRAHFADGTTRDFEGKRGDVSWRQPVTHSIENLAETTFEAIDVNLKPPTAAAPVKNPWN